MNLELFVSVEWIWVIRNNFEHNNLYNMGILGSTARLLGYLVYQNESTWNTKYYRRTE